MEMEPSSKPSLSQTIPSKLSSDSLSPPLRLSSSVPIRAPLTLDDDDEENENGTDVESNDNRFDCSSSTTSTALSVTGSEFESNEDDPDEEKCPMMRVEDSEGSSLKPFVRPIAQLSWDSDDNSDLLVCNEVDFEVDSFGDMVDFFPSVSIAPRVKVFESSENDFRGEEEEGYFGNVVLVEGNGEIEESDLVETSKIDLGIDQICEIEECEVVIESRGFGALEGFCEECDLMESEEGSVEKNSKLDLGVEKSCVEIESHGFGALEGFCEGVESDKSSELDLGIESHGFGVLKGFCEEVETEKSSEPDLGIERFRVESDLAPSEELLTQKSSEKDLGVVEREENDSEYDVVIALGIEQFCAEKDKCNLASREQAVKEQSSRSDLRFEQFNFENFPENDLNSAETKEASIEAEVESSSSFKCDFSVSLEEEEIKSQSGSCSSGVSVSNNHISLLRVKFLSLVQRLGISLQDSKVIQVLNKLVISSGPAKEAENETDLDFSLNILVLGKSGVGKSSTVNLILGEKLASVNPFERSTTSLNEYVQTVNGAKIRILDTPGLGVNYSSNCKLLLTVRKKVKKFHPNIVLYVDRLDTDTKDTDFHIEKSITDSLGSSIWNNAIIVLTHSSSAPSDGPLGFPISNQILAAQKSDFILKSICKSAGYLGTKKSNLGCQVALVENHPTVSEDSLNGWSELLLLCYSMKVLSLANPGPKREKKLIPNLWQSLFRQVPLLFDGEDLTYEGRDSDPTTQYDLGLITNETQASFSSWETKEVEGNKLSCVPRNETIEKDEENELSCVPRHEVVKEEEKEISCVPRNEPELINPDFEPIPIVPCIDDDVAAGFRIPERVPLILARGARFVAFGKDQNTFVRLGFSKILQARFGFRVAVDENRRPWVQVMATGPGANEEDGKYKYTVDLPMNSFGMRANSVKREPEIQKIWDHNQVFNSGVYIFISVWSCILVMNFFLD